MPASSRWDFNSGFKGLTDLNVRHCCSCVCCVSEIFITRYINARADPSGRAGLRRRSAAARLLRSWVWIPPGTWIFVCCECFVLSGRGLCDELITRPEESYRLWCVVVSDLEKKPQEWGGHDPRWVAAPQKKNTTNFWFVSTKTSYS